MPRVKRGIVRRAKRKKLSRLTKGYFQNKSKLYKFMKEAAEKAGVYAYVGRKRKKRDYRSLWIVRINAAAREHGVSYSVLMNGLKTAGIDARSQEPRRARRARAGRVCGARRQGQGRDARLSRRTACTASHVPALPVRPAPGTPPMPSPIDPSIGHARALDLFREELAGVRTDRRSARAPHALGRPQGQLGRRVHGARRQRRARREARARPPGQRAEDGKPRSCSPSARPRSPPPPAPPAPWTSRCRDARRSSAIAIR